MKQAMVAIITGLALAWTTTAQEKAKPNETNSLGQVALIQKQIESFKARPGVDLILTIQETDGEASIQLARATAEGKTGWNLNIAYYPSQDKPAKALDAVGIKLSPTWIEESFEAGKNVSFSVPENEISKLPLFVHDLFVKFFQRPATYKIECTIEDL